MAVDRRSLIAALGGAAVLPVIGAAPPAAAAAAAASSDGDGRQDVRDFGAVGDGVADDTAAILRAARAAFSPNGPKPLYFPPGSYRYSGPGLVPDVFDLHVFGAGAGLSIILLADDAYFLTPNGGSAVHVHDLTVSGGLGAIRDTYRPPNVAGIRHVHDCHFTNYRAAAISNSSVDQPYWHIEHNVFDGANDSSTMGIALSGDVASTVITANAFLRNRVHVKLGHSGNGGGGVVIADNDFVRFNADPANPRIDLWIVPPKQDVSGGLRVLGNKFGPENLQRSDYRVLYADEGGSASTDHTRRFPSFARSAGFVSGHLFGDNNLAGRGRTGEAPNFITSMSPEVRDLRVRDLHLGGTPPLFVLFVRYPAASGNPFRTGNVIGPVLYGHVGIFDVLQVSNVPGLAHAIDPADQLLQAELPSSRPGGADASGYIGVAAPGPRQLHGVNGPAVQETRDGLGGRNAVTMTFDGPDQKVFAALRHVRSGIPLWIEFDVRAASSRSLRMLAVTVLSGGGIRQQRNVRVPKAWTRFRFPMWSYDSVDQLVFQAKDGLSGRVRIGRVKVYHAHEPVLADLALPSATTTPHAPAAGDAERMPDRPAGYMTVYIAGRPRQVPYF